MSKSYHLSVEQSSSIDLSEEDDISAEQRHSPKWSRKKRTASPQKDNRESLGENSQSESLVNKEPSSAESFLWEKVKEKKRSYDRHLRMQADAMEELSKSDQDERVDFHRKFQMLVRSSGPGSKPRDRESEDEQLQSTILIVPEATGNQRSERLWLHLQAFWSGKPMKTAKDMEMSVSIHEKWLETQRESAMSILSEIRQYKHQPLHRSHHDKFFVQPPQNEVFPEETTDESPKASSTERTSVSVHFDFGDSITESTSENQNEEIVDPAPVTRHGSDDAEIFKDGFLERQRYAITEVGMLISKFEQFQELFPTWKSMRRFLGSEFDENLEERICVLYVWLNVTQDLCLKIRDVGRTLGMEKVFSSGPNEDLVEVVYDWPNLEFLPHPKKMSYATQCSIPEDQSSVISKKTQYKKFVEKSVRLRGMRKVLSNLAVLVEKTLRKAREALQKPIYMKGSESDRESQPPATNRNPTFVSEEDSELTIFGVWNERFQLLGLPSYYPSFLFLLRVPLDLVHHWLHLRVKQKAITEPDPHTLETLIQDCRDCLEAAVEVKCFYHNYVRETTHDEEQLEKLLFKDLQEFEGDLVEMFQTYLGYVRSWFEVHSNADVKTRGWGQALLEKAQEEWKFAKKIAINIISGESDAACQFCNFSKLMLEQMVENYLVGSCEKQQTELFDLSVSEDESDSEEEEDGAETFGPEDYSDGANDTLTSEKKSTVFLACKMFKEVIMEVRERAMRAMKFAKLLRADLEISAKFELVAPMDVLMERLKQSGHVLITTVRSGDNFAMFCDSSVAENEGYVQLLLNVTCGRDASEIPEHLHGMPGYLVVVGVENWDKTKWTGPKKHILIDADTDVALHYIQTDAVYLVVVNSLSLKEQTEFFLEEMEASGSVPSFLLSSYNAPLMAPVVQKIHKDPLKLVDPQCSCHVIVESNMDQLKTCALGVRQTISKILKIMTEQLLQEKEFEELSNQERQIYRDALILGFNFAFEYQRELARMMSSPFRGNLAYGMQNFVSEWRGFVEKFPTRREGVAPRWAQEGLQFLALALHPSFTVYLSNKEFKVLKENVQACEAHIFGAGTEVLTMSMTGSGHTQLPVMVMVTGSGAGSKTADAAIRGHHDNPFWPSSNAADTGRRARSMTAGSDDLKTPQMVFATEDPRSRIQNILFNKERELEQKLQEQRRIGRCVSREQVEPDRHFPRQKVSFRWSRMEKMIGRGASGNVYKGYNMDAKKLMAVKQISYERHDQGTMLALIDEISNFERLNHPNLVKYYGVEAHADELLIFMEYCDGGTLESVCKEGLDPILIRQYTHFLLRGINDLHEHLIVHRDIKPGNVFLTSGKEVLKLGDFGSSVRLQSNATFTGELKCFVGTPAYMAPEVMAGGHQGRASDIWSLGCVVLEMATGKPPWFDLTNPNQIIFRVGSGFAPNIPDFVSENCRDFLNKCFHPVPEMRYSANQLIEHEFAKVDSLVDNLPQS